MTKFEFDIAYDFFNGAHLLDGQDVTTHFAGDISHPLKATILQAWGPGGGNPVVEFEFRDMGHAHIWAFDNAILEDEEEFEAGKVDEV